MSPKATEKQKPQDMVLRLIRVAEILIEGQDAVIEAAAPPEDSDDQASQPYANDKSLQKTQT